MDLVLERIELRPRRRALIARRRRRSQRPPHRVAIPARPTHDLLDRKPQHELHPADLRPLLHADQRPPPGSTTTSQPGSTPTRTTPPTPAAEGCIFNRRRGVSIQPAPTPGSFFHGITTLSLAAPPGSV